METTIEEVLLDTMLHKNLVMASCCKMAKHFLAEGEQDKAWQIIYRGWMHDNSKFTNEELACLVLIADNHNSMRHADQMLPEEMKILLSLHYQNNTHHPEHWEDVSQMSEMDIVEMCCDWHARSVQYGTDLLEFARTRQECRFHFPLEMFKQIIKICEILVA